MKESLVKLLKESHVKKKSFDKISVCDVYRSNLKTLVDEMEIPVELDVIELDVIYRDLMVKTVVKKYFPRRIKTPEYTMEEFASTLPYAFKDLDIRCIRKITEEKISLSRFPGLHYQTLKISLPPLEEKKLEIFETKIEELFLGLGYVQKLPNEPLISEDERTIYPKFFMKLRGNDGNTLQMAYVKRPSGEVSYSDLYLNFFDDYYSRDYIVFIIKLLDEVQKLSKK
jgi:hypothetical protein